MRRLVLPAVLLASLAFAGPAAAKQVQAVTACGAGDCTRSDDPALTSGMIDIGPPSSAPKAPAPFYRLTMAIGDGEQVFERLTSSWVPSAGRLLAEDGSWLAVRPEVRRGLDRLTRGLAALPAAQLPGFPTDASAPRPAPPVTADGGLPVLPLVAGAMLLALVGVLVRRHAPGALRSAE